MRKNSVKIFFGMSLESLQKEINEFLHGSDFYRSNAEMKDIRITCNQSNYVIAAIHYVSDYTI